jgi:hypothetical protein
VDAVVQVAGERVLLVAGLVASWVVLASAAPVHLFPWSPSQAEALGFALPRLISAVDPLAQETLNFVLMLLAVGGTQFAAVRADTWAEAWHPRRRSATVSRLLGIATALVVATLALRIYVWGIPKIHARYGERMFTTAAESFGRSTEFGNNFAVWAMTLVVAAGAGLFWMLAIVVSRHVRPRVRRSARSGAA